MNSFDSKNNKGSNSPLVRPILIILHRISSRNYALANPNFRLLLIGRSISSIGDRISPIAMAFVVFSLKGSASDLGLVLAARTAAMIVFLLIGGVFSDRLSRQKILIGTDLLRLASQGITAVLLISGHAFIWELAVLQAIAGAGQGFFRPASTGMVPEIVSENLLQQANALLGIAETSVIIFGAGIAALLILTIGPGWAIGVDAITFGISAILLFFLNVTESIQKINNSFLEDLWTGWNEFRSHSWLVSTVAEFSVFHLVVWAPFFVLGPLIANDSLGGAAAWGIIMTIYGVGTVIGGILGIQWHPKFPLIVVNILFVPQILPLIALAITKQVIVIAASALLAGLASGFTTALWDTTLQQQIPPSSLSRVSSYDWLASMIFLPVGYIIVGPLSGMIGIHAALWIFSSFQLLSVILIFAMSNYTKIAFVKQPSSAITHIKK